MITFMEEAGRVRPDTRQLSWYEMGCYAFVHFGMNTFTNREWGDGTEAEGLFAPDDLDCDQWVEAIKAAGMKGMILTAKHHDGFCLWPSAYTEHSVKNSPYGGDVVREAAEACRRGGIRFGIYLSPWDRNNSLYGTDAYNDYFCNQLEELLTGYGDIFCVWFDNACGEGPNGKVQHYDFGRYIELIRRLQPNAVIFNDYGPDVRWCGNEAGRSRYAEWAVVPSELCPYSRIQTGPGPLADSGSLDYLYNTGKNLGDLATILYSKGLVYAPAEINLSIRPGWFWHPDEEPHDLHRLMEVYLTSYGANACMNLNVPPDIHGRIDERDVRRLAELGAEIQRRFANPIPCRQREVLQDYPMQPEYVLELLDKKAPTYVELREAIEEGQRIEHVRITADIIGGGQYPLYEGNCVGNRLICRLEDPFAGQNPLINLNPEQMAGSLLKIRVTASRGPAKLKEIIVY